MSRTASVTRVPMLSQEAARQAAIAVGVPEVFASLNVFRVLLHQPGVAKQIADLLSELLAGKALDPRQRELIIMRLGWSTHSVYEWTQHWRVARAKLRTNCNFYFKQTIQRTSSIWKCVAEASFFGRPQSMCRQLSENFFGVG